MSEELTSMEVLLYGLAVFFFTAGGVAFMRAVFQIADKGG